MGSAIRASTGAVHFQTLLSKLTLQPSASTVGVWNLSPRDRRRTKSGWLSKTRPLGTRGGCGRGVIPSVVSGVLHAGSPGPDLQWVGRSFRWSASPLAPASEQSNKSNKHYKAAAASALKVISGFACLGFCLFRVLFVEGFVCWGLCLFSFFLFRVLFV